METSGVSIEHALNRGDKGVERFTDRDRILRKEGKRLEGGQTGLESRLRRERGVRGHELICDCRSLNISLGSWMIWFGL